jgi:hypothetical protein
MIHRQETVSVLGVPVSNFIDIEDSEAILRAIRATPADQPIDLILHTPEVWFLLQNRSPKPWLSTRERSRFSCPITR